MAHTDPRGQGPSSRSFTNQSASAEDLLKSHTVGLVNLSDFRKRRAEVLEQKEKEAHDKTLGISPSISQSTTPGAETDKSEGKQPPRKKKKASRLTKARLNYVEEEEEDGDDAGSLNPSSGPENNNKSASKTPDSRSSSSTPQPGGRRIKPNPKLGVPPPRAITKATLEEEARMRDALRKEFMEIQERVKATEILVPFVFYDGTNIPAGTVKMRKGDPIWLFLDRSRKVGAELGVSGSSTNNNNNSANATKARRDTRREWARVGVDDLMCVRGNIIVPHHYEFYYFIANRVSDFSGTGGLLFEYSDMAPRRDQIEQGPLEGGDTDPTFTKVVDRRWYEKNKHIFPASLWREYEPGKEFEETMAGVRRDNKGNAFFF